MSEDLTQKLPDRPDARLEELFRLVQSIDNRLSTVTTEVLELKTGLSELRQFVNERLRDTQPLGETVNLMRADISQLQQGQRELQEGQQQLQAAVARLEEGQKKLEEGQWQIRTEMRNLNRTQTHLHDTFLQFSTQYKDMDERVFRLESKNTP